MNAPHRTYVVRLLDQGVPRVLSGTAGMTFLVDNFTPRASGPVAHVRDYRFKGDHYPYQIWSIPANGYEFLPEHAIPEPVWAAATKTLKQVLPVEFLKGEYHNTEAFKYRDVEVIGEYHSDRDGWKPWPGAHKNVGVWYVLANGKAVGWNENISVGWSFPVISHQEAPAR